MITLLSVCVHRQSPGGTIFDVQTILKFEKNIATHGFDNQISRLGISCRRSEGCCQRPMSMEGTTSVHRRILIHHSFLQRGANQSSHYFMSHIVLSRRFLPFTIRHSFTQSRRTTLSIFTYRYSVNHHHRDICNAPITVNKKLSYR